MTDENKPTEQTPPVTNTSATQAPVSQAPADKPVVTPPVDTKPTVTPDPNAEQTQEQEDSKPDELTLLKNRANQLGIRYHPSIGIDALREKIALTLRGKGLDVDPNTVEVTGLGNAGIEPVKPSAAEYSFEEMVSGYAAQKEFSKLSKNMQRNEALKSANKLIRIVVTCRDPNKRDWNGEIFTVSNSLVGTHKKYVPFNVPEGYHVPHIIYQALLEKKCQVFVNGRDRYGNDIKRSTLVDAYAVTVLPPLTQEELRQLGQRQAMANNQDV